MSTAAVAAVLAGLLGALGTYLVAVRKLSGKIATSEAAQLWDESRAIRQEYQKQNADQLARIQRLENQVDDLRTGSETLAAENRRLEKIIAELRTEITGLLAKIERLEASGAEDA